jgi:heme/copper-type cytochrome/quinol oxidase subunit 3
MEDGRKWDLGRRTEKISTRKHEVPIDESVPPASFRRMGMWLLLASLGMLFGATLVGFLVLRMRAEQWPPPGTPPLPGGLWVSTLLLIVLSLTLVLASRAARAGEASALNRMLGVSVLLAVAFLAAQTSNWMRMAAHSVVPDQSLFVWFFYLLTILHAGHVLFGLVPLVLVTIRARAGRYTAEDHETIHLVGMFWHFLLVTWVAIMVVMRF